VVLASGGQRQRWKDALVANSMRHRGDNRYRQRRTGLTALLGPGRVRIPSLSPRGASINDAQADGIAFVRIHERGPTDVQTYKAVPRAELAAVLAGAHDKTAIESCDIVLPIPSVAELADDLAASPQGLSAGVIGTVAGGVWITGPLAGHNGPREFEWYE